MTDSKYIHLLSMSIFDWQELTGLIKSICLDNVSFGYLILRVIVWSRLLHFFQPKKKKREREGDGREVSKESLGFKVAFLGAPIFKVNLVCDQVSQSDVPSRTPLPDGECFLESMPSRNTSQGASGTIRHSKF